MFLWFVLHKSEYLQFRALLSNNLKKDMKVKSNSNNITKKFPWQQTVMRLQIAKHSTNIDRVGDQLARILTNRLLLRESTLTQQY